MAEDNIPKKNIIISDLQRTEKKRNVNLSYDQLTDYFKAYISGRDTIKTLFNEGFSEYLITNINSKRKVSKHYYIFHGTKTTFTYFETLPQQKNTYQLEIETGKFTYNDQEKEGSYLDLFLKKISSIGSELQQDLSYLFIKAED